jgi:hypothetical protein
LGTAYNLKPPYPREEATNFVTLRKWSHQFYGGDPTAELSDVGTDGD